MRRWLLTGVLLVGVGVALGYAALVEYRRPGPLTGAETVVVPRGGFVGAAAFLRAHGVVRSDFELRVYGWITQLQGSVRAAELAFPAGASIEHVLMILRHGRPVQHLVTVPEGATAARVGQILATAQGLSGGVILPDDGAFLPETYAYELGMSVESVVTRAQGAMRRSLDTEWASRSAGLTLKSEFELLILASLVERETHLPAERGLVAAVFLNRLRLGMKLQSDPTVIYAVSGGASELSHGLMRDELAWPSPYNTYAQAGLPAGPICNPGLASIRAAAHPAHSAALYFVADGSGGHAFAASLQEHEANVARVRQIGR